MGLTENDSALCRWTITGPEIVNFWPNLNPTCSTLQMIRKTTEKPRADSFNVKQILR